MTPSPPTPIATTTSPPATPSLRRPRRHRPATNAGRRRRRPEAPPPRPPPLPTTATSPTPPGAAPPSPASSTPSCVDPVGGNRRPRRPAPTPDDPRWSHPAIRRRWRRLPVYVARPHPPPRRTPSSHAALFPTTNVSTPRAPSLPSCGGRVMLLLLAAPVPCAVTFVHRPPPPAAPA